MILLMSQVGFADASFQSTSQITGGTMVDQLKSFSFLGKSMNNLFAPTNSLTMVHGNQKAVVNKDSTEITDLDKETITHIDTVKKTYSVVTFAQMRQAFANAPKQLEQVQAKAQAAPANQQPAMPSNLKTSFEVSAKNTGVTKVVNGISAQEQLVTMQMHMTDTSAPPDQATTITYVLTTDAWIAPDPPEIKEIQDFDLRMGKKMMQGVDMSAFTSAFSSMRANSSPGLAQMFGSKPGSAEAMEQMGKEMAKLKGTHIMDVTRMGGSGSGPGMAPATDTNTTAGTPPGTTPATPPGTTPATPPGTTPATPPGTTSATPPGTTSATPPGTSSVTPPPTSDGSAAGQVANDTAAQTAASGSSKLGALGSAFSRSALGSFHKKKSTPPPADTTTSTPDTAGTQSGASAVLMEMTVQKSNFSQEAVPSSVFQVPAGFTLVPSTYDKMGR
jgi:hypothetical protein